MRKHIVFSVTNDTSTDQRMHKIGNALGNKDYEVTLIGRRLKSTEIIQYQNFSVFLLKCWFNKGFLFYLEYNLRLFFTLLYISYDAVCAVDVDTVLAVRWATIIKRKKMFFDSHEYFTHTPELVGKSCKKLIWRLVEMISIWKISLAYTVNKPLALQLQKRYGIPFETIRNLPNAKQTGDIKCIHPSEKIIILYQGVMNVGRGLELYIQCLPQFPSIELWLVGNGDIEEELKEWIAKSPERKRIKYFGKVSPNELNQITGQAHLGLNMLDPQSKSYYWSLANKFFDYMQAGVPSINMDFPVYRQYLEKYNLGYSVKEYSFKALTESIQIIINDPIKYQNKSKSCLEAANRLSWEKEAEKLMAMINNALENKKAN